MTDPTLAAMDLAASFIKEQQERIADLEQVLTELANTADGAVELDDWPELQASLANARAILNKEKRS